MNYVLKFVRNWTLPISMAVGALSYVIWSQFDFSPETHRIANTTVSILQPMLIFSMLFISFCKVNPKDLRITDWHHKGIALQVSCFIVGSIVVYVLGECGASVITEAFMLSMICPTATAAAVVTQKLGGNAASLVSYTMIINLTNAVLVSAVVPIIHPEGDISFFTAFLKIISKIFPMLILPLFIAMLVRWYIPKFHSMVLKTKDLAFYMWAVALPLAIAVSVREAVHSKSDISIMIGIGAVSLLACIIQFVIGRKIGGNDKISSGQALGQKNTVFAIWMGYTFFDPVVSLAGGFYSIWHNVFNSWQLYKKKSE